LFIHEFVRSTTQRPSVWIGVAAESGAELDAGYDYQPVYGHASASAARRHHPG
jgi:hypothetical protein